MQQRNEIADKSADHNSISRQTKFPKPIFLLHLCNSEWTPKKEKKSHQKSLHNIHTTMIASKGAVWLTLLHLSPPWNLFFLWLFSFLLLFAAWTNDECNVPNVCTISEEEDDDEGSKATRTPLMLNPKCSRAPLCCWVSMCQVGGGVGPNDFCAAEE